MRNRKSKGPPLRMFRLAPDLVRTPAKSEGARELWSILAGIVRLDGHTHVNIEWHGGPANGEAGRCLEKVRERLVEAGIPAGVISTRNASGEPKDSSLIVFPGETRRPRVVIVFTQEEKEDAA